MKARVLFLCTGNSARSQMAEGWLRHLAGDRFEVFSAGSHPVGLNPVSVEAMAEVGIDISDQKPKLLTHEAVETSDVVITMGCGDECPLVIAKERIDWKIPDPRKMTPNEFNQVRDLIEGKVKSLLAAVLE